MPGTCQVHGLMPNLCVLPLTSPTQDPPSHQVHLAASGRDERVGRALQTCGDLTLPLCDGGEASQIYFVRGPICTAVI